MTTKLVKALFDNPLIQNKESKTHPGLFIHKYKRKVFYNNLWHTDIALMAARGIVTTENTIISHPFTKVFNVGENGTKIHRDTEVMAVQKINGFLGVYRNTEDYGKLFTTTGSFDSDFVGYFKEYFNKYLPVSFISKMNTIYKDYTFMFEVCHHEDPHIIDEEHGLYLIGARNVKTGAMMAEASLDLLAYNQINRPYYVIDNYGVIKRLANGVTHEGFIIKDSVGTPLAKLKSPYYLTKKFIMRSKTEKLWSLDYKQRFDEEYYELIEHIRNTYTQEYWNGFEEQQKAQIVNNFFK